MSSKMSWSRRGTVLAGLMGLLAMAMWPASGQMPPRPGQPAQTQMPPRPNSPQMAQAVKGHNVTSIEIGPVNGGAAIGQVRQDNNGGWVEVKPDGSLGNRYEETKRDEWSLYLIDRSRGIRLQFDLNTRQVHYLDNTTTQPRVVFAILSFAAQGAQQQPPAQVQMPPQMPPQMPQQAPQQMPPRPNQQVQATQPQQQQPAQPNPSAQTTGHNLTVINYAPGGLQSPMLGQFRQVGPRDWAEVPSSGAGVNQFEEVGRNAGSVFLVDRTRGLNLQLDLTNARVTFITAGSPQPQLLFTITAAASTPIAQLQPTQLPRPLSSSNQPAGPSQQQPQQGGQAQANPGGQAQAGAQGARPTGRNLTLISLSRPGGPAQSIGMLRQTGPATWLETSNSGPTTFQFEEIGRTDTVVYLVDRSRGVTLQLDVANERVWVGSSSNTAAQSQHLYNIIAVGANPIQAQQGQSQQGQPAQTQPPPQSNPSGQAGGTQVAAADDEVFIDEPDLPAAEINAVMRWIKIRTTNVRLPFCWKQSYGIGVGKLPKGTGRVADCPASYTNNGMTCGRGTDDYGVGSRVADCPSGYTNMGAHCGKGFLGLGSTMGMGSMVCRPGEFKTGARCYTECRAGYTNMGESCHRPVSTLGMGSMVCPKGEVLHGARCYPDDICGGPGFQWDAGLCYPECKAGYSSVGPVCWQRCGPGQVDCGAGCAASSGQCGSAVAEQVLGPLIVAANIASLGLTSGATAAAGDALRVGGKTLTSGTRVGKLLIGAIKKLQKINPKGLEKGATITRRIYYAKLGTPFKQFKTTVKVGKEAYGDMQAFKTAFADEFAEQTSKEIEREVDAAFSNPKTRRYIKEYWGGIQLAELASANDLEIATDVLSAVSMVDLTGVTGVVSAYAKPQCQDAVYFPALSQKY